LLIGRGINLPKSDSWSLPIICKTKYFESTKVLLLLGVVSKHQARKLLLYNQVFLYS
jgi:hypothetical protein